MQTWGDRFVIFLIFTFLVSGTSQATESIGMNCTERTPSSEWLECDLRLSYSDGIENVSDIETVSVFSGDVELSVDYTPHESENGKTAILFIVDTSDPRRKKALQQARKFLQQVIEDAPPNVDIGVASFDSKLENVTRIGSSTRTLLDAVNDLKAKGKTTELYRSTRDAVKLLSNEDHDRKALVLLTDGKQEDTEYTADQVIKLAKKEDIVIYGIAFLDKKNSTDRQTLIKLSEETAGPYVQSDKKSGVPKEFTENFYQYFLNGGKVKIDVSELSGENKLVFDVESKNNKKIDKKFYTLNRTNKPPAVWWEKYEQYKKYWKYFAFLGAALLLLFLIWIVRKLRLKTYATFETLDSEPVIYKVKDTIIRIGRNKKCDIQLENDSVSSFHASLKYTRDGEFILSDLNSLNGTLVDGKDADDSPLGSGSIVELGEVRLRFTSERAGPINSGQDSDEIFDEEI